MATQEQFRYPMEPHRQQEQLQQPQSHHRHRDSQTATATNPRREMSRRIGGPDVPSTSCLSPFHLAAGLRWGTVSLMNAVASTADCMIRTADTSVPQPQTTSGFGNREGVAPTEGVGSGLAPKTTVGYRGRALHVVELDERVDCLSERAVVIQLCLQLYGGMEGLVCLTYEGGPLNGVLSILSAGEEDSPSTLFAGRATDIELGFPAVYIIAYWKQKEAKKFAAREKYPHPSDLTEYAAHRRYMVDWISEVGEQLDLQTVTIHSAVSFLDELMMLLHYNTKDWHLYAVCCLSVAAKYEEAECNMPMISELADATEMSLTTPIVTRGELELVQKMQWDVSRVTAMHFLGYYTSQGVTFPEDTCQGRRLVEKVVTYMKKYVDFFANLCQQDYQFQSYRPSHIAAASILAARRALCIKPLWRDELTELTGYRVEEIVQCCEELWNFYENMFPTHRPLRTDPSSSKKAADQQASTAAAASGRSPANGRNAAVGSSTNVVRADSHQFRVGGVAATSVG